MEQHPQEELTHNELLARAQDTEAAGAALAAEATDPKDIEILAEWQREAIAAQQAAEGRAPMQELAQQPDGRVRALGETAVVHMPDGTIVSQEAFDRYAKEGQDMSSGAYGNGRRA